MGLLYLRRDTGKFLKDEYLNCYYSLGRIPNKSNIEDQKMSILSIYEGNVVINQVEATDTIGDIYEYISNQLDEWGNRQVLWDLTLFDFESIDQDSIRFYLRKSDFISEKRSGLKTAILVDSDFGFGMTRMFQLIADEKIKIVINVFKSKEQALQWLTGEE